MSHDQCPMSKVRRRWRPRFTLRTFALVVSLLCAYLACWAPTKFYGVPDVMAVETNYAAEAIAPLFVKAESLGFRNQGQWASIETYPRRYFWFFGGLMELPTSEDDGITSVRLIGTGAQMNVYTSLMAGQPPPAPATPPVEQRLDPDDVFQPTPEDYIRYRRLGDRTVGEAAETD